MDRMAEGGRMAPTGTGVEIRQGNVGLQVVGESYYQDALRQVIGGDARNRVRVEIVAVMRAEMDNPFDPNAVSIWIDGLRVGYLARADAARYRPGLLALESSYGRPIALGGVIAGGGIRADGPGLLGVFLRHDPRDFDVSSREGLSRRNSGM